MPVTTHDGVADQLQRVTERALRAIEEAIAVTMARVARMLDEAAIRIGESSGRGDFAPGERDLVAAAECHYATLRGDAEAWASYEAEQDAWDRTAGDGLDPA